MQSITVLGRVGQDPEIREFDGGRKLAKLPLAETKRYKTKDGEKKENTTWFSLEVWGPLANVFENYVKKGSLIAVRGEMKCQKHEDKYYWSLVVQDFEFAGGGTKTESKDNEPKQGQNDLPF
jgi:single-strand DNA-binding protein